MNVISYSLWGTNKKYTDGAIHNIKLAKELYPDWKCLFYISKTVDQQIIKEITSHDNVYIALNIPDQEINSMIWRFKPFFEPFITTNKGVIKIDRVLIRDTDSRFTNREVECVKEWIDSNKSLHVIKDHVCHRFSKANIMGGLCGLSKHKLNFNFNIKCKEIYDKYSGLSQDKQFQSDQDMLYDILQLITNQLEKSDKFDKQDKSYLSSKSVVDYLSHDEFCNRPDSPNKIKNSLAIKPSIPREKYEFMGAPFDQYNKQEIESMNILKDATNQNILSQTEAVLYFHQGYTDIFNCMPLIRYYSYRYTTLHVLMREEMKQPTDFFVRDLNNVKVYYDSMVNLDNLELLYKKYNYFLFNNDIDCLIIGYNDNIRRDKYKSIFTLQNGKYDFCRKFYLLYDLDYSIRTNLFHFKRDLNQENTQYNKFIQTRTSDYKLCHYNDEKQVKKGFFNLNKCSDLFFDYIKIIENAKEIECIDSSWSVFIYLIQPILKKKCKVTVYCRQYKFFYTDNNYDNFVIL